VRSPRHPIPVVMPGVAGGGRARRRRAGLLLAAGLLGVACAAPPRDYRSQRPLALAQVDYSGWDALLRAHARNGVVDYPAFAAAPELDAFLDQVRRARFSAPSGADERLAFWINAYNALAIRGILDGGSPAGLLGRYRFFLRRRFAVAGEKITLWDLEHARIRPLGEPRIHFALVCASASCPKLASEAYLPGRLDEQLERAARAFVNDPERNRFDRAQRVAWLSAIFDWYAEDFAADAGSPAGYVAAYVADPELARSLAAGGWRVQYLDYDWSLNGTPPRRR
jgi:hypothetical protein